MKREEDNNDNGQAYESAGSDKLSLAMEGQPASDGCPHSN